MTLSIATSISSRGRRAARWFGVWLAARRPALWIAMVVAGCCASAARGQSITERAFTNLNLTIPDNDPSGVVSVQAISGTPPGHVILDVSVSLKIAGAAARNGDLYVSLDHSSGFSVLLNRVGRTTNSPAGYGDAGVDIWLEDRAPNGDVHLYRAVLFGNHETPIGQALSSSWAGAWAPDGRYVDPAEATDESLRQATLSSFRGLPVDGRWRLFVADVAPGGVSQLQAWSLRITSTTNLNALKLEFEDATFRAESEARKLDAPVVVKGRLTVAGGRDTALAGNVSGTGALIKEGEGKLVLSGVNTFSGGIVLQEGVLVLDSDRATGIGSLKLKGGAIHTAAGSRRVDNAVSLSGQLSFTGGGKLELSGSVRLDGSSELAFETDTTISGDIEESEPGAGFIKRGAGKLTLSGVNTFSGGLSLEEGTLAIGNDKALGTGKATLKSGTKLEATGGARALDNDFSFLGSVGISGGVTIAGDVSLAGLAQLEIEGTTKFSGTLSEEKPGTGFVKKGAGTLVLEGSNTISGGVTLDEGVLLVNNTSGSGTGSGAVAVTGSAILGGRGNIAGAVTLSGGAQLAPGASPGTLTTGSQTWEAGAELIWEINDAAGSEGADAGWDTLQINGTLQINATPSNPINFRIVSLGLNNAPGPATHFDTTRDYVWTVARTTRGVAGFDAAAVRMDTSRFRNSLNGGQLRIEVRGNDLVLVFTGVPPPRVTKSELVGNNIRLFVQGAPNQSFRVEASDSIAPPIWVQVAALQTDAAGLATFDAPVLPGRVARFYRIVVTDGPGG